VSLRGENTNETNVQIYNLIGQVVYKGSFLPKNPIRISTQVLPAGQYFMKIRIGNQEITRQLVKM